MVRESISADAPDTATDGVSCRWVHYVTGTSPVGLPGKDRRFSGKKVEESRIFESISECCGNMIEVFCAYVAAGAEDASSIFGTLGFEANNSGLAPFEIGSKPHGAAKISYYPIGTREEDDNGWCIGKITVTYDGASDLENELWIVEPC